MHTSLSTWLLVPMLALTISGCGSHESTGDGRDTGHFGIRDKTYTLNAPGVPSAKLGPDGELTIGGKALALSPQQRELARRYHAEVGGIANDGIEIGKQGMALAGQALKEAFRGVFSGQPQTIGPNIEAQGERIKSEAMKICDRLVQMQSAQDALAAAVPEFAPYAQLETRDVEQCRTQARNAPTSPRAPDESSPDDDAAQPHLQDDSASA